jgi:predicted amidophosphoribosyltransferase
VALAIKLSKLGFDAAICHNCGKIFERTEVGETLCQECKTTLKQEKPTHSLPSFLNIKRQILLF